jgi:hypothetical protein
MWKRGLSSIVLISSCVLAPAWAAAKCLDNPGDPGDIAAARAQIDGSCLCPLFDGTKGKKHQDYFRCAKQIIVARIGSGQLRQLCSARVRKFYDRSACGFVLDKFEAPCVVTNSTNGRVSCIIEKQDRCHGFSGSVNRVACFASPHCIDVADTNGDLTIGFPGDDGTCVPPDLTDNGDGTITDHDTGLMWEKKSDDAGLFDQDVKLHDKDNLYMWTPGPGSIFEWIDAVNAENGTGFAGHNDWRIPTILELRTLIRRNTSDPAIAAEFDTACAPDCTVLTCSCTESLGYWSSTPRDILPTPPGGPTTAWGVDFFAGDVGYASMSTPDPVRAVRGGF